MKLRMSVLLLAVMVLGIGAPEAAFCSQDAVPAATLLFPFVVLD